MFPDGDNEVNTNDDDDVVNTNDDDDDGDNGDDDDKEEEGEDDDDDDNHQSQASIPSLKTSLQTTGRIRGRRKKNHLHVSVSGNGKPVLEFLENALFRFVESIPAW